MGENQQREDIVRVVENIFLRDQIIMEDGEVLRKIGIFVLRIGVLEDRIKTLLFLTANLPSNILDNMTLGVAIKELEKLLPNIKSEYDKNSRDYRLKKFFRRYGRICSFERFS